MRDDPKTLQEAKDRTMANARAGLKRINNMSFAPRVIIGVILPAITISILLMCAWVLDMTFRWVF